MSCARTRLLLLPVLLLLLPVLLSACEGGPTGVSDGGPTCAASKASGLWLLPFGPVTQEIMTGGQVKLMVVVTRGSAKEGEGAAVPNRGVTFRIIDLSGDASLDTSDAQTDTYGIAQVTFRAGAQEKPYQVEASLSGTCPTTFSLDVRQPMRQLRAVTKSPYDTFTGSKVPITVEAVQVTNKGAAKLAGEDITFSLGNGKTAETLYSNTDGSDQGATLQVKTNGAGRAIAMLTTGSKAIGELMVKASMSGTAEVEIKVRIAEGKSKSCQGAGDCPLGYTCKAGVCEAPPVTPPSGCTSDAECAAPTICQVSTGKCLMPTGATCDPVEGTGCKAGEVCVGRQCATLPPSCTDNSTCPSGFLCQAGACVPAGKPPTGGCVTSKDCQAAETCINGDCKPKTACNIVHAADRLQGTWQLDSMLHFRDALSPILGGLLKVSGLLRDVIEGNFKISGIPSVVSSLVSKYLKKLIDQYVPPWGQQLIVALGDINDIVSDMRVISTAEATSVGNDDYVVNEQWDLVEFTYKGQKLSTPPDSIPEIGQVKVPTYGAHEVCGVLFIDKHKIENVVGGVVKWAINAALSAVTCNTQGVPCYNSVDEALEMTIDCGMLGMQIDMMVMSIWSSAPSVAQIIETACNAEKANLIQSLMNELDSLTTKLSLLSLSGTAPIPNPPGDTQLQGGKWFGILGGGNFQGEFSATKQP